MNVEKMKTISIRIIIAVIVLIVVAGGVIAFADSDRENNNNSVEIKLVGDVNDIAFGSISVNVCESIESKENKDPNSLVFTNNLIDTMNFSNDGKLLVTRPSNYFLIDIVLSSLPEGYGVSEQSHFFKPNENYYEVKIEKIVELGLAYDDNHVVPTFWGRTGMLQQEYEVLETNCEDKTRIHINEDEDTIFVSRAFTVTGGSFENSIIGTDEYHYKDEWEKTKILYELGGYSEKEYTEAISRLVLDDVSKSSDTCADSIYEILNEYNNKSSGNQLVTQAISHLENMASASDYDASVYSAGLKFLVFYNQNEVTSSIAQDVANEFDSIYSFFVTYRGYPEAFSISTMYAYEVYITDDGLGGSGALTIHSGVTHGSKVKVAVQTAIDVSNGNNTARSILAHEYMHGIIWTYSDSFSNWSWFNEAFASWAGALYHFNHISSTNRRGLYINFLQSPELSLTAVTNNDRHYGSSLFPIYIYNNYGGHSTIKKIYNALSSAGDGLDAVKNGLSSAGYTFNSVLAQFYAADYHVSAFYSSSYSCIDQYTYYNGNSVQSYPYSNSTSIIGLATKYDVYKAPAATCTLTININTAGTNPIIKGVDTIPGSSFYINTYNLYNYGATIVKSDFGVNNRSHVAIIPVNPNSGSAMYSRNAQVSGVTLVRTTFNPGSGASCGTSYVDKAPGTTYGSLPTPTKSGYVFVGWFNQTSPDGYEVTGSSTVPNSNTTLYAHWAKTYKVINVGANKCLNIWGSNLTSLSNGINVTLWTDSGSNEQKWLLTELSGGGFQTPLYFRSIIDRNFGLNAYRSGSPWNCNMRKVVGNETDAMVDMVYDSSTGYYKIRLHNYSTKVLTAGGSSAGSNVYWTTESSGNTYQLWSLQVIN